jgi:hypothetical protein
VFGIGNILAQPLVENVERQFQIAHKLLTILLQRLDVDCGVT